ATPLPEGVKLDNPPAGVSEWIHVSAADTADSDAAEGTVADTAVASETADSPTEDYQAYLLNARGYFVARDADENILTEGAIDLTNGLVSYGSYSVDWTVLHPPDAGQAI